MRTLAVAALLCAAVAGWAAEPRISSQSTHALALSRSGQVYSWGWDTFGELGVGRPTFGATVQKVAGIPAVAHVSAGSHVAAVDTSGNVWTWGIDLCGTLGEKEPADISKPGRVKGISGALQVAAGRYASETFTAALRSDGSVWHWGALLGCSDNATTPRVLSGLTNVVSIQAGGGHLLALRSDGTVWAAGDNEFGQLGDGTLQRRSGAQAVPGLTGIVAIAAGFHSSIALRNDGVVFAWGSPHPGNAIRTSPSPIAGLTAVAKVFGDGAVKSDGTVVTWDGTYVASAVSGFTSITQFTTYENPNVLHAGLRQDGTVVVSGRNAEGQHGLGSTAFLGAVTQVPGLSGIKQIARGELALLALTAGGDLYAWGSNRSNALGLGDLTLRSVPTPVAGLPTIAKIAAGTDVSYALDGTGQVWAWGSNGSGHLGDGTLTPRSMPQAFPGLTNVVDIAAGCSVGLFAKSDGTVWYIGYVLAIGSLPTLVLKQVGGLPNNIVSVAAGCTTLYAIGQDGKAYAWGDGSLGMIGNGSSANTETPTLITAFNAPVKTISANATHALAVTTDGGVWSWGLNFDGQLGDGTTSTRNTPARIPGLTGGIGVAAGRTHSMALLTGGAVRSWGRFALGDGAVDFRTTPGPVQRIAGIAAVAAGTQGSYAVGADGVAYGWGENTVRSPPYFASSPVGDGTFARRSTPVLVLRENAAGNLDSGDWFLDLDAAAANNVPAALIKKVVPVARGWLTTRSVTLLAGVNFRLADYGKKVGTYVVGLVPGAFLSQVPTAPQLSRAFIESLAKSTDPILVQLTPSGWSTVDGVFIAYAQGVVNGNGGASRILDNVNPATIPGSKVCIGYGESADSMLRAGALTEVLTLEGVQASSSGLPCILAGVYVEGPPSSMAGSPVTFKASVIGVSPTGSVQFKDGPASLLGPVALAAADAAVAGASLTTDALSAGLHSIGASYSGDGNNAARSSEIPLKHEVKAAPPASTVTEVSGPSSSEVGATVTFNAIVTGKNVTGTVQFKDGGADLGAAQPLSLGLATLGVSSLGGGAHSITAAYSGDSANAASTSNTIGHTVYAVLTTSAELASSANPSAYGSPVTLTAKVAGTNPTGQVTFHNGSTTLGIVPLAGGTAALTLSSLPAGVNLVTATYGGDGNNQTVSAPTLFQQVLAQPAGTAPNAFSFAPRQNVAPNSGVTSNAIVVGGLRTAVPIVVAGGSYSIGCTDTFTGAAGLITNGQSVCVRHTSAGSGGAATYTTLSIGGVSSTFTSTTYTQAFANGVGSLVTHYYQSILRRAPDAGGQGFWSGEALRVAALGANVTEGLFALALAFYASPEYSNLARDNTGFATDLYTTFFNRAPDAGGLAFWKGQLDQGMPREVALAEFLFSPEFRSFTQAIFGPQTVRAEIDMVTDFYRGLLARLPDDSGFGFWRDKFRAAQCQGAAAVTAQVEAISSAFALSGEYAARARGNAQYVGDLYNGFLRRGGDLAGVQFWIGTLTRPANPLTREGLRVEFKNSPEFQARVNALIQQGCLN